MYVVHGKWWEVNLKGLGGILLPKFPLLFLVMAVSMLKHSWNLLCETSHTCASVWHQTVLAPQTLYHHYVVLVFFYELHFTMEIATLIMSMNSLGAVVV